MGRKKGQVPWNKGVSHTKETKEKISQIVRKRMDMFVEIVKRRKQPLLLRNRTL